MAEQYAARVNRAPGSFPDMRTRVSTWLQTGAAIICNLKCAPLVIVQSYLLALHRFGECAGCSPVDATLLRTLVHLRASESE